VDDVDFVCALKFDRKKPPEDVVAVAVECMCDMESWKLVAVDWCVRWVAPELLMLRFGDLNKLEALALIIWGAELLLLSEDHRLGGRTGDSQSKSSW
jgi:hypothetical protein